MDGKKVVIIYVSIIILIVLAVVVGMQIFFHVYEPKEHAEAAINFIQMYKLHDIWGK